MQAGPRASSRGCVLWISVPIHGYHVTKPVELQMLLGVRAERARQLVAGGHPLRIYVPYGEQWYEYSLRRLQENPKVAGYVARDVVGRVFRR